MSIARIDWKAEVRRRLGGDQEAGIVEEIAQDLEARYDALLERGIDDLAARH
jgi:hypothetical protein